MDIAKSEFVTTVWLAVRCCCTPNKVFGFLPIDERDARRRELQVGGHSLTIKRLAEATTLYDQPPSFKSEWAIYSEDRPLEFWRRVPGFIEAKEQRR